jgi:hypothetical protein
MNESSEKAAEIRQQIHGRPFFHVFIRNLGA